eukprot:2057093-Rhodomonas_salina.3
MMPTQYGHKRACPPPSPSPSPPASQRRCGSVPESESSQTRKLPGGHLLVLRLSSDANSHGLSDV